MYSKFDLYMRVPYEKTQMRELKIIFEFYFIYICSQHMRSISWMEINLTQQVLLVHLYICCRAQNDQNATEQDTGNTPYL